MAGLGIVATTPYTSFLVTARCQHTPTRSACTSGMKGGKMWGNLRIGPQFFNYSWGNDAVTSSRISNSVDFQVCIGTDKIWSTVSTHHSAYPRYSSNCA